MPLRGARDSRDTGRSANAGSMRSSTGMPGTTRRRSASSASTVSTAPAAAIRCPVAHLNAVTGGIWVCYPIGGDRPTGIDEEFIRHAALDIGLVDDKRAHLDALWSGLRLVWKPKPRLDKPRRKAMGGASA